MDLRALLVILQLIYLEGILSVDNAAVLAAMVGHLPREEAIPWPQALQFLSVPAHRAMGGQRGAALKVGLAGAYLGRAVMLVVAAWVIRNHWLLLLGALYLIKVAVAHLGLTPQEARAATARAAGQPEVRAERRFWEVVLAVELADLAFSLDNVVAAVGLSRQVWVVMTGVFLGILAMRFAAAGFTSLLARYPVLEATAYLLMLIIGIEMLAEELFRVQVGDLLKFAISLATFAGSLVYGQHAGLQRVGQRLVGLKRILGYLEVVFDEVFKPVGWIGTHAVAGFQTKVRAWRRRRAADSGDGTGDR